MKTQFKIINGIPHTKAKRGRPAKYPFGNMKVNQHFVFSKTHSREIMQRASATANAWLRLQHFDDWKFKIMKSDKNEILICRVK